jgi:hypothetical protein
VIMVLRIINISSGASRVLSVNVDLRSKVPHRALLQLASYQMIVDGRPSPPATKRSPREATSFSRFK